MRRFSVLPLKPLGVLAFFFLALLALVPKGKRTAPVLYLASALLLFLGMSAFL